MPLHTKRIPVTANPSSILFLSIREEILGYNLISKEDTKTTPLY